MIATTTVITPQQLSAMDPKEIRTLPNGVPMILHQTWKDRDVLPKHQPYVDSWDRYSQKDYFNLTELIIIVVL